MIGRHRAFNFVIINNRTVEEWLILFGEPILGTSALDHLVNASCQIVIAGGQLRRKTVALPKFLVRQGK